MTKGHVPDARLWRYRKLKELAEQLDTLAGRCSGWGRLEDANTLFTLARKYSMMAADLRVEIPDVEEGITE